MDGKSIDFDSKKSVNFSTKIGSRNIIAFIDQSAFLFETQLFLKNFFEMADDI